MWRKFLSWLHHLTNPHCTQCAADELASLEESKRCKSCEILQHQLEVANFRNEQIIRAVLNVPEPEQEKDYSNIQPIKPRFIPWKVRRQALETLDRERAKKPAEESNG